MANGYAIAILFASEQGLYFPHKGSISLRMN